MFELLFMGGILVFALPLVFCAAMAYLLFWLVSAVLKTAGVVVGGAVAVVFCLMALVGAVLFAVVGMPFFLLF
jgi:hypothetical protein